MACVDNAWGTTNAATAAFGNGGSGTATVSLSGNLTASGGLAFNAGATYTVSIPGNALAATNKLTIAGGITVADNVAASIVGTAPSGTNNDIVFSGVATINVGNNASLVLDTRFNKTGTSGLTKNGNGVLILAPTGNNGGGSSVTAFPYIVNAGVIRVESNTAWGNSANAITVNNGAAIELDNHSMNQANGTTTINGMGIGNNGAIRLIGPASTTSYNAGTGSLTLATTSGVGVDAGSKFTINQKVIGPGGLTKLGGGNLVLNGIDTYGGATTITAGTLSMGATGTAASTTGFDVQTSATMDVSAVTAFAVGSSQSLTGAGTLVGAMTINGILAPGESNVGTLSTNAAFTLAGTSNFEIDKSGGNVLSNDLVTGITSLTEGGALNVAFLNSGSTALAAGDSFKLFNAGSYAGGFSSVSLPSIDPSLTWDTSALGTAGVITVAAAAAPEPASLAVLALGAASLLTRRRK